MAPFKKPIWERLFDYIEPQLNGCWLWRGCKDKDGYGGIFVDNERWLAHRFVYFFVNNRNDTPLCVCHACDVPSCVNPDHLFLGTIDDNNKDRALKGRSCKGEKHDKAKLSRADVERIRMTTESGRSIARDLGVDKATVYKVRRGHTWKS
jgi:hypothetical protein